MKITAVPPNSDATARPHMAHQNNFDSLRLVFSSMVVLFHIGLLSRAPGLHWMLNISSTFAVQAFFFVSGFLVTMSSNNTPTLSAFACKRFLRIAPAYVSVVCAAAISLCVISKLTPSQYFFSSGFANYVQYNLLLSNFAFPTLPGVFTDNPEPAVNGSLWTIKIEVLFYCVVPIMTWACRRFGYQRVLSLVIIGSLIWRLAFDHLATATHSDLYARLAKQLPGQLAYFAGGAVAYYRTRAGLPAPAGWMAAVAVVVYAATDGIAFWVTAPFAVTVIAYWLAVGLPRIANTGKYGDFSYGIYLFHFPIVQVAVAMGLFQTQAAATALAVLAVTSALSVVSWFGIERRFLRSASPRASA